MMSLILGLIVFVALAYVLYRSARGPDTSSADLPPPSKSIVQDESPIQAERRQKITDLAEDFNVGRREAGLSTLEPDIFASDVLARVQARSAPFRVRPPVVLLPASRETADIETEGTSWFGGLPTLGDLAWPRARDQSYMHLAAQIDVRALATLDMPDGFPVIGSLAFFVDLVARPYSGAVVYIPQNNLPPTQPMHSLPRLFSPYGRDDTGYGVPGYTKDNAPQQFPRWPMTFHPVKDTGGENDRYDAAESFGSLFAQDEAPYFLTPHAYAKTAPDLDTPSKWDTAQRFANLLTNSRAAILELIKEKRVLVDGWPAQYEGLQHEAEAIVSLSQRKDETTAEFDARSQKMATDFAQKEQRLHALNDRYVAELSYMTENIEVFADLAQSVHKWAFAHDPWDQMYQADIAEFEHQIAEVTNTLGDDAPGLHLFMLARPHMDHFLGQTLRAMIQASDEVYAQLPQVVRDDFDKNGRPGSFRERHQVFGTADTIDGSENREGQHLLLCLGRDHAMNWQWGESGAYFWIKPEDLENQRWANVQVVIGQQ